MFKQSITLKASTLLVLMLATSAAFAGSCAATKAKEAAVYGTTNNNCGNVTTTADITKNPYTYTSPNGGCNMGLSLPGLPNFGNGGSGLNACSIVKAITGPMVAQVNQGMQTATNTAINSVGKETVDTAVNAASSGGDISALAQKTYNQVGSPTSIQQFQQVVTPAN